MKLTLNAKQIQALQPYVNRVRNAAVLGSPGMLVGQISWDQEGRYWITPAFLDHELAKIITEQGRAEIPGDVTPGLKINSDTKVY
jgi:hypothetical protein